MTCTVGRQAMHLSTVSMQAVKMCAKCECRCMYNFLLLCTLGSSDEIRRKGLVLNKQHALSDRGNWLEPGQLHLQVPQIFYRLKLVGSLYLTTVKIQRSKQQIFSLSDLMFKFNMKFKIPLWLTAKYSKITMPSKVILGVQQHFTPLL